MRKTFQPGRLALLLLLALPAFAAGRAGIEPEHFDRSVRIQDNLYQAVNGNWLKHTDIPADQSEWGGFTELHELSQKRVRELIEAAVAAPDAPESQQIGALYRSYLDEDMANRLGLAPLKPLLAEIEAVADRRALTRLLGNLPSRSVVTPLQPHVGIDDKNATRYLAALNQGGLGMPDRDYYLKSDARFKVVRKAYLSYLTTLLREAGFADADRRAQAVLAFETRLARIQWDQVTLRDPHKTYNKLDRKGLARVAPQLDWNTFLDGAEMGQVQEFDLGEPSYARALARMVEQEPLEVWRDYLRTRTLDEFAGLLHQPLVQAHFDFHGKTLSGMTEMRPRWKRAVRFVEALVGESIGKHYVAKYFPAESKAKMEALVGNLLKAFDQSIDGLSWMSPVTKRQAKEKLQKYRVKIGYPSKWRDYSGLEARPDDLVGNAIRGQQFHYRYDLARLGQPVDREEWGMTPQTVNAYYHPGLNEIVFPAAVLQPPFFYPEADDAVNYGAIGAIIGHEISHGFDDQGSQYDGDGNLRNWWQPADRKGFERLTSKLVQQYNRYEALPKHFVNGRLTLGENIADLSGLQIAFKAYQLSLNGKPSEVLDGFSGEQRFFIGFGQAWRSKAREPAMLQQLVADPHSPEAFRAIGSAMNSDAFHQTFGTKPGDGMYKPESQRIRIW
ncbi:M13 family metallopeptidase [Chitinimonas lacunae]|uniref:M13 family metallopeptidase n=1 Tax=Chitinimonas lacunae TaxID=1963018 RepID=A0ABV8MUH0_9NEIS